MKTRITLLALVAMGLAALAVACGRGEPKVTVEKGLAAAAEQRVEGEAAPESASLALQWSEMSAPAAVPGALGTRAGMSGSWGLGGALAPSAQGAAAGLTVQGYGRATAPADSARVQFVVTQSYGFYPEPPRVELRPVPEGEVPGEIAPAVTPETYPTPAQPTPLTEEDLEPLVEAIQAQGVSEGDIEVTIIPGGGYYGPYGPETTARVTVTLRDMDKPGPVVEDGTAAVNESGTLFLQNIGVSYRVDDCDALLDEARGAAIEDARDNGEGLADALGVSRGALLAAWEYSYDPTGYSACSEDSYSYSPYEYEGPPYNPAAPAEVQIVSNISLTYAIQ
jgi:uncharacterized protein YggE